LAQVSLLPGGTLYTANGTFAMKQSKCLRRFMAHCDRWMVMHERFNIVGARATNLVHDRQVSGTKTKRSTVHWAASEATVPVVVPHHPYRTITDVLDVEFLWMGATGDTKFFPHFALVLTIKAYGVVRGC
jgi:hypothetical protein